MLRKSIPRSRPITLQNTNTDTINNNNNNKNVDIDKKVVIEQLNIATVDSNEIEIDTNPIDIDIATNNNTNTRDAKILSNSYWLTRIVYLRFLGFIYFIAFLISYQQNNSLIGINGLTPAITFLNKIALKYSNNNINYTNSYNISFELFQYLPTIFWFILPTNQNIEYCSIFGLILSGIIIILGNSNSIIMSCLWLNYISIVNIGQNWYGFGWESLLLEIGFLSIFMVPIYNIHNNTNNNTNNTKSNTNNITKWNFWNWNMNNCFNVNNPTPILTIFGCKWLIFRLMIGAGLIKIRGDICWSDLTCMQYHYQTQPVPNPISLYLHILPTTFHTFEVIINHTVELILPILLLIPSTNLDLHTKYPIIRCCRLFGGLCQILFQCILIISGNLSFLNWLSIVPCVMCFDDESICWMFTPHMRSRALNAQCEWEQTRNELLGVV